MRFTCCIILSFLFAAKISASDDSLTVLLLKVKESTYYDSSRFFNAKEKALNFARANNREKEILPELSIYQGNYFFYTRNLDSASACFKRALTYSRIIGSAHYEILSKIRLLYIDREFGIAQNAQDDMDALLRECSLIKDVENELEIYNLMAIICEEKGEYKKAVDYYLKGLNKAELNKQRYYQSTFLNNLGLIRYSLNQNDKALNDFDKSILIAQELKNERLLNHAKMNRCIVLIARNKISSADSSYREVLQYSIKNKLPLELASAYANIGSAYFRKEEIKTGLNYLDSAIHVFEKYSFKAERIQALLTKCHILIISGRLDEAFEILKKNEAEILSSKGTSVSDLYSLRADLMYKKKNYKEAYDNYHKFFLLQDSLRTVFNTRIIDELQLKYNVQKKEIELEKEKSKSLAFEKTYQKERFLKWIVMCLALLGLVGASMLFFIIYNRKMREKQREFSQQLILQAEEDRSRIARDLHDDIGQSLSILKAKVINNAIRSENPKDVELEIERIIEQTRQIARALYPSYIEKMGLIPSVSMLAENVQKSKGLEVSFEISKEAEALHISTKTHLFHIIQESVTNTLRHSGASALKIMIENDSDHYTFTYLDNGSWTNSTKPVMGVGLLSMKERVEIIKGTSYIEQNHPKGFKLTIKFSA